MRIGQLYEAVKRLSTIEVAHFAGTAKVFTRSLPIDTEDGLVPF
jgi:hypothetical protein